MSTLPSFSAYYAHKRAWRNAVRLSAGQTSSVPCKSCDGKATMQIRITTIGINGTEPESVSTLPCIHCKDGLVNPMKQIYSSLIWCRCKSRNACNFVHAVDGRRVFGNDTYLCGSCGFVKQFG